MIVIKTVCAGTYRNNLVLAINSNTTAGSTAQPIQIDPPTPIGCGHGSLDSLWPLLSLVNNASNQVVQEYTRTIIC